MRDLRPLITCTALAAFSILHAQWDPPIPQSTGLFDDGLTERNIHGCTDAHGNLFLMAQSAVQRWDTLGHASWDPVVPVPNADEVNRSHMVVPDGDGGCFIGYVLTTGTIGPYIQHLDSTGTALLPWPGQRIITPASSSWSDLWMVRDTAHLFVTITSDAIDGERKVFAQKLDLGLQRLWGDSGKVISPFGVDHRNIQCLTDDHGGLVLLFRRYFNGINTYMRLQHVDSTGAPLWGAGVALHTTQPVGSFARAQLRRGMFGDHFVCWDGGTNALNTGIYMNRVDSAGALPWGPTPVVVNDDPGRQDLPTMSIAANGDAYVAWRDQGVPSFTLNAQRVDTSGTLRWDPAITVDPMALSECFPKFVREGDGMRLFWTGYVQGYTRILTQVFDSTGTGQCGLPGDTVGFVHFRNIIDDLVLQLPQGAYVLILSPSQFTSDLYLQITDPVCELVTSVGASPSATAVRLFPSPTSDVLHLAVDRAPRRLTLCDLHGRRVLEVAPHLDGRLTLDVSALTPGVYVALGDGVPLGRFVKE